MAARSVGQVGDGHVGHVGAASGAVVNRAAADDGVGVESGAGAGQEYQADSEKWF